MIAIKRNTDGKYNRLLDQLQILEYIETNNRPLTPRECKMQRDYQKQIDALNRKKFKKLTYADGWNDALDGAAKSFERRAKSSNAVLMNGSWIAEVLRAMKNPNHFS